MTRDIWYAVSKRGQGRVFTTEPVRNDHWGIWEGEHVGFISMLVMEMEADGFEMPMLKWGDDPVKLTITLGYG